VIAAARDPLTSLVALERSASEIDEPVASRRAASLTARVTAAARESRAGMPGPGPRSHPLHDVRAELTLRSRAFRHAARLSVALIVAGAVYRGLSLGSGYWVPLTVLFVLKPDYGTTITRAIGRAAGTMVGVTIAWAIVTPFSPSDGAIVALLAALAFAAYALFPANYALFSVLLTVLIARRARTEATNAVGRASAEPPRRRPDDQPLRAVLAAMDQVSECALVLAAGVHDGARAPRQALAPYRVTLGARFRDIVSAVHASAWSSPAQPRDVMLDPGGHDPAVAAVAAETAKVLAELERLEQTWNTSAHR
jgi:hypothetical protein